MEVRRAWRAAWPLAERVGCALQFAGRAAWAWRQVERADWAPRHRHSSLLSAARTDTPLQEGGNGGFPSWQHGAVEGGQGQGAAVPGTGEEGGGPGQGGQAVREEAQSQQEERGGEAPPVLLASLATTAALATPSPPDPPDPFAHPAPNAPSAPSCPSCPPSSPACPASLAPSVLTLLSSGATAHLGRARVGNKVYLGVQALSTCIQAE